MLEQITAWWNSFLSLFDAIPEDTLAITVYVGGTIIALLCWYGIARRLPSPFGGITWIILFVAGIGFLVGYCWSKYKESRQLSQQIHK